MEKIYVSPGEWCEHPGYGRELMYRAADVQALARKVLENATYASLEGVKVFEELRAIVEGNG